MRSTACPGAQARQVGFCSTDVP